MLANDDYEIDDDDDDDRVKGAIIKKGFFKNENLVFIYREGAPGNTQKVEEE